MGKTTKFQRICNAILVLAMLVGMLPMQALATEANEAICDHTYENGICTGCGAKASPYLQQLPENIVGCTNLYDRMVPVKGYYTATKYDTSNGAVISVVIPVEPGDRIAASSFGSVSENMGSVDGIRVSYLLGDKIATSLSAGEVYNGYTNNGYITVPDGVDAVCIPWWKPSDSNWLTLSQISKDFAIHSPKNISAQAPTCTENGYTAGEICEVCNAALGEREEIPPTGHTYCGDTCIICGAVNLEAIMGGKYVSVLGDSISTFNGYSNDAATNTTIGGNGPRYDEGTADTKPGSYCLLESVDDTWWMHFANRSGMKLLVNNSWAGSQVFGGQTSDGRVIPAAYLDRCVNLHDNTLENNPENAPIYPDVIFVYLGINDYNFSRNKVGTGAVDYAGLVNSDGTYVTPETFGEAYGIMLHKMREAYPDAQIFAMTLLPENLYSVDKNVWEQHNVYIRAAADYYDIPVVDLAENCAITWENYSGYMIDKIHPKTAGMKLISDCIEAELAAYYKENPPHIHSYTSTVTAPTCTEQGYTTYTCQCGHSYVDSYVSATGEHTYDDGICTVCGAKQDILSLRYDDHYDVSGKVVEILDAGNTVVTLEGDYLVATGIGSAQVKIDGVDYAIAVEKAKINLVMVVGQSNSGNHFPNATSDVTCPPGTAYHWGYGATEPTDYTQPSMGFHAPLLAELYAQSVAAGDPVKNILVWEEGYTSKNGQSVTAWAVEENGVINTAGTDGAAQMVRDCLAYYEQNSDKYEVVHKVVFCNHGTTDHAMETQRYIRLFTAMWERLKAEGMEYVGFLRVRGAHSLNTPENADTYYNAASSAQFEMVRTREDMFMATTLAEAWTGPASTVHSIDIRNFITVMETYGQTGEYSDSYGNKASYADGMLTTTMKELYGSNNKVHYGKFGYGLIGADAAYNMYAALNGTRAAAVTQTDSSGLKSAERICAMGSTQTINIETLTYNLSFYPTCGSPKGTMRIMVEAEGVDITEKVVSSETSTFGTISTETLRSYVKPVITVSYTYGGKTEEVIYTLVFNHPCNSGHDYESVITAPTCTEQGYTTYTCSGCGHSYVDDYTDAIGHTYENGLCTTCGTHLPGDINGDGAVNNKDAMLLFQYLSGWKVEIVEEALDVNGDGTVNNKDATRLFQYVSGWKVELY